MGTAQEPEHATEAGCILPSHTAVSERMGMHGAVRQQRGRARVTLDGDAGRKRPQRTTQQPMTLTPSAGTVKHEQTGLDSRAVFRINKCARRTVSRQRPCEGGPSIPGHRCRTTHRPRARARLSGYNYHTDAQPGRHSKLAAGCCALASDFDDAAAALARAGPCTTCAASAEAALPASGGLGPHNTQGCCHILNF